MALGRIIASPPRLQALELDATEEDINGIIPEIIQLMGTSVKLRHLGLAWHGYREYEDFIIDKGLDLQIEGDPLDLQVYAQELAATGIIGNIILYILDRGGDRPVTTIVLVDHSNDDLALSNLVKLAGVCFVDGFLLSLTSEGEGDRIARVVSHFMIIDNTVAATRTSLLYTRLIDQGFDVRLLLTDLNSQVYYFEGAIEEEELEKDVVMDDEPPPPPGSIEELRRNLEKEI